MKTELDASYKSFQVPTPCIKPSIKFRFWAVQPNDSPFEVKPTTKPGGLMMLPKEVKGERTEHMAKQLH